MLSKSKYIRGLQCERGLWLEVHNPRLARYPAATLARFRQGRDFEREFKETFPLGIDISRRLKGNIMQYPVLTARLLSQAGEVVLFEAGFVYDGVLVLADVLHKDAEGCITVYEVKDSLHVSDTFRHDVAIQHYVIAHALPTVVQPDRFCPAPQLRHFYLLHHDDTGAFVPEELTDYALSQWDSTARNIARFKAVVAGAEPHIPISDHCQQPYACPFIGHCKSDLSDQSDLSDSSDQSD